MNRYQIRNEFFGSIAYDYENKDFIAFDSNTTNVLKTLYQTEEIKPYSENSNKREFITKLYQHNFINKNKLNYEFLNNRTLPYVLSAPLRIHLAYTSKCNLNCAHCFARDYNNKMEVELSYEQKINILYQMKHLGINEILIGGGEPFIKRDFIDFIQESTENNINTKVFTNGLLLQDSIIKKLKDIKLGYLSVSIDGACDRSYSSIRGIHGLNIVLKNIRKLTRECDFPIVMQITATKTNLNEIKEILDLAYKTNVKRLKIRPIKPGGNVLNHPEIMISADDFLNFIYKAETYWRAKYYKNFELDYSWGNARLFFHEKSKKICVDGLPQPHIGYGCLAGKISMFIDPFGNVFPCVFLVLYLGSTQFENITNNELITIWNEGPTFKYLRNLNGNENCKKCIRYDICRGGCIARILYEGLKISDPDPWCLEKYFHSEI